MEDCTGLEVFLIMSSEPALLKYNQCCALVSAGHVPAAYNAALVHTHLSEDAIIAPVHSIMMFHTSHPL